MALSRFLVSVFQKIEYINLKLAIKCGKRIADKVALGEECFYWADWSHTFGFNDLEPIRNCEAVSKYVTKYITKDLIHSVKELNAHTYYCSKNLNRSTQLSTKKIDLSKLGSLKPNFVNDYCRLYWLNSQQYKLISNDNL